MLPAARRIAFLALLVYGGLMLVVYLRQDSYIYYPNIPGRAYETTPAQYGMPFEPVALTTSDGVRLAAWYVPAPNPRGTLLYVHGNGGNISHRLDAMRLFHELGLSVLAFDYRGYGQSQGTPSEQGTYLDADAAWQYLTTQRGTAPARIIVFGESLGGAIAAHLAARVQPAALVLAESFTSAPDLAAELFPWLPARWITHFHYDTRRDLAAVHVPVLVAHSRDDDIIPFHHGKELFEAAHEPRHFIELQGTHNELFSANRETLAKAMKVLLDSIAVAQRKSALADT